MTRKRHLQREIDEMRRALQESVRWRNEFTANISHDIRTPLAIARGYAETLYLDLGPNSIAPQDRAHYLKLVVGKIKAVEHMVQQLLNLSKIESYEQTPEKQPFVFSEIVQEFLLSAGSTAKERAVTLTYFDTGLHSWVEADIRLMERVIQNLVINAIHYSPAGSEISCRLGVDGGRLSFFISNPGPPLPAHYEHWVNGDATAKMPLRPQGSGLGLAIVKQIVRLHRFSIMVERAENMNHFILTMPLYIPSFPAPSPRDNNSSHS